MGGGAVLSIGFWMHVDPETTVYIDLLRTVPTSGLLALFEKLPAVFILIGGSVAILSFLGCCGACVDSACFISLVRTELSLLSVTNLRRLGSRFPSLIVFRPLWRIKMNLIALYSRLGTAAHAASMGLCANVSVSFCTFLFL